MISVDNITRFDLYIFNEKRSDIGLFRLVYSLDCQLPPKASGGSGIHLSQIDNETFMYLLNKSDINLILESHNEN